MRYTKEIGGHEFDLSCDLDEIGIGISVAKMNEHFSGWTYNLALVVQLGPITFLWMWDGGVSDEP